MDYNYVESLAQAARLGDAKAKEALAAEFTPLILKLSRKAYINSYDFEDIKNEGYKTLFKCISMYDLRAHRFVAYAAAAIKNSVNYLIRSSAARRSTEGINALVFDDILISTLSSIRDCTEDAAINRVYKEKLKCAIKALPHSEQELVSYIYFKGYSLKKYTEFKGITYYAAAKRKEAVLQKLEMSLNRSEKKSYLN